MGTFTKVAQKQDVPSGGAISVTLAGKEIALFHSGGIYYAIGDTCSHAGGPLCEGEIEGTVVTCPWHGASFDITTGRNLSPPAPAPVTCYKVRVVGENIEIET